MQAMRKRNVVVDSNKQGCVLLPFSFCETSSKGIGFLLLAFLLGDVVCVLTGDVEIVRAASHREREREREEEEEAGLTLMRIPLLPIRTAWEPNLVQGGPHCSRPI